MLSRHYQAVLVLEILRRGALFISRATILMVPTVTKDAPIPSCALWRAMSVGMAKVAGSSQLATVGGKADSKLPSVLHVARSQHVSAHVCVLTITGSRLTCR